MSQLTEKYVDVYVFAKNLGCTNLIMQEEEGNLRLNATCPTRLVADQIWNKVKEVDAELNDGDLMMSLTAELRDTCGGDKVRSCKTFTDLARSAAHIRLTYRDSFEANRGLLDNTDRMLPDRFLIVPRF